MFPCLFPPKRFALAPVLCFSKQKAPIWSWAQKEAEQRTNDVTHHVKSSQKVDLDNKANNNFMDVR